MLFSHRQITKKHLTVFIKFFVKLFFSFEFILITLLGNTIIFLFSAVIFYVEGPVNDQYSTYLDALWWAFSTATTVGYGDKVPITVLGKILGIILMVIGTGPFASYITIMTDEVLKISKSIYK